MKLLAIALLPLLLAGCPGGSSDSSSRPPQTTEQQVRQLATAQGLSGTPHGVTAPVTPDADPKVRLGEALFFARSMSVDFSTACASCHHPQFASGDGLSLPVGVAASQQFVLGPDRVVDSAKDRSPVKDGGPDVPRNSQPIYNVSLYREHLFWDGRVQLLSGDLPAPGATPAIKTPESGNSADPRAGVSLLMAQSRFPIVSADEMRGFGHAELSSPDDVRERLIQRLRGNMDTDRVSTVDAAAWLQLFRTAYAQPAATADQLITIANVQEALAAYQQAQIFVDTPWSRYLKGDETAIGDEAKVGALLFFRPLRDGGLGCAACHTGDHLTDEEFYNIGFPQIGHGKRPDRRDFGRYDFTHHENDRYAFRVPSLLNVALTGPWSHDGAFDDLGALLDYHVDPQHVVDTYDFTLSDLDQFTTLSVVYSHAGEYTREALAAPGFAGDKLPQRPLTTDERTALLAFLAAQSDIQLHAYVTTGSCVDGSSPCPDLWIPGTGDDVDGNTLYIGTPSTDDSIPVSDPVPSGIKATPLVVPFLPPLTAFADTADCAGGPSAKTNTGNHGFVERAAALGIAHRHGYDHDTWMSKNGFWFESLMMHAGVTGAFMDDDCWPDLLFAGGDWGGALAYRNDNGTSFATTDWLDVVAGAPGTQISAFGVGDLDGDYRRELIVGLYKDKGGAVLAPDGTGHYSIAATMASSRNIYGIALGDYDNNGYLDVFLAHWGLGGPLGTAPVFWQNDLGTQLKPYDRTVKLSAADGINQALLFTPAFADVDMDGWLDLLVTGDFSTSLVLRNVPGAVSGRQFANVTDRDQIVDENGMGSAVGDFDNDGDLDWFVSSIDDPNDFAEGAWGLTGNKLYRNDTGTLHDVSATAGIAAGLWGWGSCFADFNNDGWLDIFQENGFGYLPEEIRALDTGYRIDGYKVMAAEFINTRPRLFINNHNGTFSEQGESWGLEADNGRGVVCFDYDRDGDMDIAVAGNSVAPRLYENQMGRANGFVAVRLVGLPPNTEALGARVYVTADLDRNGSLSAQETQMRVQNANSNYASQDPPEMHFGLQQATQFDLRVVWPDGSQTSCPALARNHFVVADLRSSSCE